ncbi:MAG: response regulator transcription factor [Candidatus Limimorpha sp.]
MRTRIIICEGSPLVTAGLTSYLEDQQPFVVVAYLDTPERLSERVSASGCDMMIIDPTLLAYSERDLPEKLKKEYPHLLILALVKAYIDPNLIKLYDGVIEINDTRQSVMAKLNELNEMRKIEKKADDGNVDLSKRENDVLVAVAKGMTNKEISDQLNISIHTVISHRKNISKKTGIRSVSGLTVYALLNNLITESEVYK